MFLNITVYLNASFLQKRNKHFYIIEEGQLIHDHDGLNIKGNERKCRFGFRILLHYETTIVKMRNTS